MIFHYIKFGNLWKIRKINTRYVPVYHVNLCTISKYILKCCDSKFLEEVFFYIRWHRLALSIKGNSATLLVDCEVKETLLLNRKAGSTFNLAGALVVGTQITSDVYYDVRSFFLY